MSAPALRGRRSTSEHHKPGKRETGINSGELIDRILYAMPTLSVARAMKVAKIALSSPHPITAAADELARIDRARAMPILRSMLVGFDPTATTAITRIDRARRQEAVA